MTSSSISSPPEDLLEDDHAAQDDVGPARV